ncbi:LuxR C-terminal-related transcriptional regulator [Dactylosporangium sucinum]|uniref:Transcriptional regulator n=1 Tax=Dactylosporangium sucinum TaxID=1424081 RepID=A0A917X7Y6_9ACTN|nr:LuxR C-terminal-related transcriptional regulator [Dactylosporangium sucinum]GGM85812.1 transcriptional regulator [Dactylosporangium sucinum]
MPDLPPGYVMRDRVIAQLDAAVRAPLTLVTAPAGWGKTAALVAWARTARLGDGSESPVVRWVTSHSAHGADVPGQLLGALSTRPDEELDKTGEWYGDDLLRAVDALERPHIVVVDDVREISDADALAELEALVRHGMGRLHLVLSCRRDPSLPLYRWRVNGSLTEMRTNDLSLTIGETAQLLAAHDVVLPGATLYELHSITEGWPAGVRLAAMAMRGHPEPERVLDDGGAFSTAVGDFLTGEVIESLPPDTRRLLLEAAVAPRLNAGLVEAITGRDDGARVLAELKGSNAFLTRNAGPGGWYRFHPLFARTLHAELLRRSPERVPELHRRAAAWHATYGIPAEAMRHALLAEDWPTAVEVLEKHWPDIVGGVRYDRPHEAAPHAPGAEEAADPRLVLAFAAERLRVGDLDGARDFLRRSDRDAGNPMLAGFAAAEAWLAGDARRTLSALPELHANTDEVRALAMLDEGEARLRLGELAAAGAPLHGALVLAQRAGMAQTQVCAASQLAVLEATRGRLRAAARLGRQALVTADRFGITDATDLGWVRMALASVYGEWDRIQEADRLLDEGLDLAAGDPDLLVAIATVRAKLRHGAGRLAAALEVLHTARRELGGAPLAPSVERALALTEAELRISGGDLGAARRLVATGGDPDVFPGWAACVDASAALVEGKAAAAASTAAQFATPSTDSALTWTVHAAILTSLAGRALGDRNRVLRGLETALDIAEEESFRRPFLVGGHPVRDLLANFAPLLPVYHPLAAELAAGSSPLAGGARGGGDGSLVEPLTERELTVLRYLQGTMSNLEIASTLYVSVNTVKTHVKNIYRKLHAGRRREAVERARELRLL